jgi:hypothetical protein
MYWGRSLCSLLYRLGLGVYVEPVLYKFLFHLWYFIRIPSKNIQIAYQKVDEFGSLGQV